MTKKHGKRRTNKPGKRRVPLVRQEDGDNLYDEIDTFHNQHDEELLKLVKQPSKPLAREILRVRIDDDEEEEEEEGDDQEFEDYEEPVEAPTKATTNKWGKRRRNYYGSSYVDKDFGGVRDSEEEEMLELEEEDALNRQKGLEAANSMVNFDQLIGDLDEGESGTRDIAEVLQIYPAEKQSSKEIEGCEEGEEAEICSATQNEEDDDDIVTSGTPAEETTQPQHRILKDNRRGITYEIKKNKGIRKDKGRKRGKHQHSRVMKRTQYHKALIKRRSQVPDLRRELTKYDGEKRGIRISTIRSIKL